MFSYCRPLPIVSTWKPDPLNTCVVTVGSYSLLHHTGIFAYVEEKGMEMDISVERSRYQAAFMLAALRELREDSRELKKKQKETESADKGEVLGPLLGPAIKSDTAPATPPADYEMPENLEFVGLETDLPVGYKRLRWALLSSESRFVKDGLDAAEAKYEEYVLTAWVANGLLGCSSDFSLCIIPFPFCCSITFGEWSKHDKEVGLPTLPAAVKPEDIIGSERENRYATFVILC